MVETKTDEKIEAPWLNLEMWRDINVPVSVWEDKNLQAYLARVRDFRRILLLLAFVLGTVFGRTIIMGLFGMM